MLRIALFGGSFDPIHLGHLQLAMQLFKEHGLDELFFCPAAQSPFKEKPIASGEHRKRMVELAIEGIPGFYILLAELSRGGISYTIDTLRLLRKRHPNAELFLILSEESFKEFPQWKDYEEILTLAKPLVGPRQEVGGISSTEIRSLLKKGIDCSFLIPRKTLDYIHSHHLYC